MALAGYTCSVKVSGTATALSGEATDLSALNAVATITDKSKRVIDPSALVYVYDNGNLQTVGTYTVDYLFGVITKNTGSFTGPVVVTGYYLPILTIASATGFSLSFTANLLDESLFNSSTSHRRKMTGLLSMSGSISGLDDLRTDVDPGGATQTVLADFLAGTTRLLSVVFNDANATAIRCWAKFKALKEDAAVDDLIKVTLEFDATAEKNGSFDDASTNVMSFGWGAD